MKCRSSADSWILAWGRSIAGALPAMGALQASRAVLYFEDFGSLLLSERHSRMNVSEASH